MIIRSDLHLHSCLSPCGDLTMSPSAIVKELKAKNIKLAALTDHNTSLNCPAFHSLCQKYNIGALYGMEAQTAEEIHVLCLFNHLENALQFSDFWYKQLPTVMNKPEKLGDQVYVSETDEIIGEVKKYLITSGTLTIEQLAKEIHKREGLFIPAHVDRQSFSLMSQLGCIPQGPWDALEFVHPENTKTKCKSSFCINFESKKGDFQMTKIDMSLPVAYPVITSSDAHYIEQIGRKAFEFDIGDLSLLDKNGDVNLKAVAAGLAKRVKLV